MSLGLLLGWELNLPTRCDRDISLIVIYSSIPFRTKLFTTFKTSWSVLSFEFSGISEIFRQFRRVYCSMSSILNFRSLTSVRRDVTSGTRTSVKAFLKTSFFRISEIAWCCADSSLEIESKSSVIYLSHQYVLSCHFWLCCLLQKTVLTFW